MCVSASAISVAVMPFCFACSMWYRSGPSVIPPAARAITVTRLRSRAESSAPRDRTSPNRTSPNRTSPFNSANLGAKSPGHHALLSAFHACFLLMAVSVDDAILMRRLGDTPFLKGALCPVPGSPFSPRRVPDVLSRRDAPCEPVCVWVASERSENGGGFRRAEKRDGKDAEWLYRRKKARRCARFFGATP